MKERARPHLQPDLVTDTAHGKRIQGLDRRAGLAERRPKGAEIVPADEKAGRSCHRVRIKRFRQPPHAAAIEGRRRRAVEDAIAVHAGGSRKAGVKSGSRLRSRKHCHRRRLEMEIGCGTDRCR